MKDFDHNRTTEALLVRINEQQADIRELRSDVKTLQSIVLKLANLLQIQNEINYKNAK